VNHIFVLLLFLNKGHHENVNFLFPFDSSSNIITRVKCLDIFNSNAKPKRLLCLPLEKEVIFKVGDNLFNDQICIAFLAAFNEIWKHANMTYVWSRNSDNHTYSNEVAISNCCYKIAPFDHLKVNTKAGFIEFMENSEVCANFRETNMFREDQHKFNNLADSVKHGGDSFTNLLASGVATFVSMYALAFGDRHQGNVMISKDFKLFNIDFGYSFGETPLVDTADFPIPFFFKHYLEKNGHWRYFVDKCWSALQELSYYEEILLDLACKHINDQWKLIRVEATLKKTLNIDRAEFERKIDWGSVLSLPKTAIHNFNK